MVNHCRSDAEFHEHTFILTTLPKDSRSPCVGEVDRSSKCSSRKPSKTPHGARRLRFVVNTTAVCRGCFVGHARTTTGIAHGFCVESCARAVASGGPEGEARRRSPKAKPEGEARRRSPTEKQVNFISAELTRSTPTKAENNAQRTPSGGGTQTNAEKARPIARHARAAAAAEAEARRRNRTPRRHQPRAHYKTGRRYLEDKQTRRGPEKQKVLFRVQIKSRAPARKDDPRRHRPMREIDPPTRLDHETHRGGRHRRRVRAQVALPGRLRYGS